LLQRLPPIGFWSYARRDEESAVDNLRGLRRQLKHLLQGFYGRDEIKIFQDVAAIPPGAKWAETIAKALDESTFLIPIITPNFLQSEFCMDEVAIFLETEREINERHPELGGQSRIFPIHYIAIDGVSSINPGVHEALKERQWTPFVDLRFEGENDKTLRLAVAKVAQSIKQLLFIDVEIPTAEGEPARTRQQQGDAVGGSEGNPRPQRGVGIRSLAP